NTLDMGLSGMMTLALCGLLLAQRNDATASEERNWMLACWAGMALSVMSKGLIGIVLPGAVLVLYTLVSRDWAIWKRLHFGAGLCLFLAISAPWFVLVSLRNPEFARFFFIHEHFERFTSKVHHREGPWYYFIPILLAGILPWLGMLAQSLWQGWREEHRRFQPQKMLLAWSAFIFLFFSISSSKLPSYILPIFPALALLIALYLQKASAKSWITAAGIMAAIGAGGLALAIRLPYMKVDPLESAQYQAAQPWVIGACIVMVTGALVLIWQARRHRTADLAISGTIMLATASFIASQLLLIGSEPYGRYRSGLALVPAIETVLGPETKLYAVGLYDQTLPFYLRRTMILVAHPDELEFGLEQEPHLWLPTLDAFIEQWRKGPKAVALTRPEIFAELKNQGVPMRIVAQDSRRIVITNDLNTPSGLRTDHP
ncbi:MAG TPA: glycosyltransferase family 39 protein, partial [Burkholderiaceae bacterium]|nr:glycosyltransferase family 39 protein [Burkholderiaceae bacterium]